MGDLSVREAWVRIPSEEERRAQLPPGAPASAYNFGFIPAMARLQAAHDKIGPALGHCSGRLCSSQTPQPSGTRDGCGRGCRCARLPILNAISRRVSACGEW